MPKIPKIGEGQRIQARNPVAIGSSASARGFGEDIAAFGRATSSLGGTLGALEASRDRTERALTEAESRNEAQRKAIEIQDRALQEKPKDINKSFDDEYIKAKDEYIKSLDNEEDQRRAEIIFDSVRNQTQSKLFGTSRARRNAEYARRADDLIGNNSSLVYNAPGLLDEKIYDADRFTAQSVKSGFIQANKSEEFNLNYKKELIESAMFSRIDNAGDLDGAIKDFQKYQDIFSSDEQQAMLAKLEDRHFKRTNRELQIDAANIQKQKLEQEQKYIENAQILGEMFKNAGGDPAKIKQALDWARASVLSGEMKPSDFNALDAVNQDAINDSSEQVRLNLRMDLENDVLTPEQVARKATNLVAENKLRYDHYSGIMALINQKQAGASALSPRDKADIKNADMRMNAEFGEDLLTMTEEDRRLRAEAFAERDRLVFEKGMSVMDATFEIIRQYKGNIYAAPFVRGFPREDQMDEQGLLKVEAQLYEDFRSGIIDVEEFNAQNKRLRERGNALRINLGPGQAEESIGVLRKE